MLALGNMRCLLDVHWVANMQANIPPDLAGAFPLDSNAEDTSWCGTDMYGLCGTDMDTECMYTLTLTHLVAITVKLQSLLTWLYARCSAMCSNGSANPQS